MHKHKLIIISDSGLLQRHFDIFYLDALYVAFDFEYWDCSKILLKKEHRIPSSIKRPYDIKIRSLWHFYRYVSRLPKDSLIIYFALLDTRAYLLNKVLSSFFKHIIRLRVSITLPNALTTQNIGHITSERQDGIRRLLKKVLYRSEIIRVWAQMLFHPANARIVLDEYMQSRIYNLYSWHVMSCVPGSEHKINASNFEKYMRCKDMVAERRFIVYVDQFFPYHKELQFDVTAETLESIAQSHFTKLNNYFSKIEKEYNCPVVIAAHPLSQYLSNPFEGREIQYGTTDLLISQCEGVLMHNSGSISYVILNDKRVALLLDSEYKNSNWGMGVLNLHRQYGIEVINIEEENAPVAIPALPEMLRDNYVKDYCGEIDEKNFVYNDVLIVKCLNDIYREIYENSNSRK